MSRICLIIVSWLLIISASALADIGAVLRNGVGARAAGMGMAQVSVAMGSDSIYWNPAALAGTEKMQLATSACEIYGTNYRTFGFAFPTACGKWGLLFLSAGQAGIPETVIDAGGRPAATGATLGYDANVLYLTYAREFGRISAGINAKYLSEGLAGKGGSGLGADVGLELKLSDLISVGMKLENIIDPSIKWNTSSEATERIEAGARLGTSVLLLDKKLLLTGDVFIKNNNTISFFAGGEYQLIKNLLLRCGLFESRPTFGLGLNYIDLAVDYAYVKGNDYLDDSHRLSLSFAL